MRQSLGPNKSRKILSESSLDKRSALLVFELIKSTRSLNHVARSRVDASMGPN
jgi:hypothetical protein